MAKYDVTFSCGHTETVQLFGKTKSREDKIEYWERSGFCSECYKKQQAEITEKRTKEAGLPGLEGTEKQIAWANKIRLELISAKQDRINGMRYYIMGAHKMTEEQMITQAKSKGVTDEQIRVALDKLAPYKEEYETAVRFLEEVKTTTSAKWIIDNRL